MYLKQIPQEKAGLMKLLTIELLFDGASLTITPRPAFSALLNLRKSHKLERTVYQATGSVENSLLNQKTGKIDDFCQFFEFKILSIIDF